ncbi:MAG TPA: AAA family ATPase [Solirubrobacteraceae bacterium]|nr:AAA family ATPase [Solirubrobacteraceae bacterium]
MESEHVRALVGRAHELAELEGALDRLAAGDPWCVQIVGEPGIGKSRLLSELCRRGEDRGYLVLNGRAAEFERDIPFGLIVDALNDYFGSLEPAVLRALDDDIPRELAAIFPALPRDPDTPASRGEGAERYRLHYAVRGVLERLAGRQPLLLALDDVHWADAASVEMLAHLLRRFRGPGLTAVAYRQAPSRLLAALEGAARAGRGSRLEPALLTADEAERLIGLDIDDTTRAMLYRESGGNPFYIEQLVRAGHAGRIRARRTIGGSREAVPRAVLAAIQEEVVAISDESRCALEAAAVAGESFEPELVAAVAEQNVASVFTALDELLESDFIRPTEMPRRFRFRHPIVRRAVYDGIPQGWQIGAHARAAAALEAAHAPVGARAHHVESSAAVGDERAISLLVQAGRDAAPRAPETAGRWLLAAARLLRPSDDERRRELLGEAATALTYAGAYDEALGVLDTVSGLLPPERVDERAELVARIAFARRMNGHPFQSRALVESTLTTLAPGTAGALGLTLELALDHYWRGEFGAMYDVARDVADQARGSGQTLYWAWGAALCSLASSSLNRPGVGLVELREAEVAYDAVPDEQLAEHLDVGGYIAQAASALERADNALAYVRRVLELAERTGQSPLVPGLLVIETNALVMKGRIAEALAVADSATDAVLTGNDQVAVWALWADAMVCSLAGDTTRALGSAREALARSERLTETFFSSLSRLHLAAALNAAGDPAGARAELSAVETGPGQRLLDLRGGNGWELLTRTLLALGELDAAAETAATADARARTSLLPQRTATAVCARAAVLLARGDPAGAIDAASEALPLAESAGNPVLGARARALIGTALGRAGSTQPAIAELEEAERTLYVAGALREADAAAQELRRLGRRGPRRIRDARSGAGGIAALSPREREVATLVAAGKRNRDVAAALFVSEKTVESHLARIYDKLGVRSRAALAAIVAGERAEPALR